MKKITLRLSDELHEKLKQLSEQHHRSINGELINLIQESKGGKKDGK